MAAAPKNLSEFDVADLKYGDAAMKIWLVKCFEARKSLLNESLRRETIKLQNARTVELSAQEIAVINADLAKLEQQKVQIQTEWRSFVTCCQHDDQNALHQLGMEYLEVRRREIAKQLHNAWGVNAVFEKKKLERQMLEGLERTLSKHSY